MRTKLFVVILVLLAVLALAGVAAADGGMGAGGGLARLLPDWMKWSSASYIEVQGPDVTMEVAKPFVPIVDPVVTMLVNPGEDIYPGQDVAEVLVYYSNAAPIEYGVAFTARPDDRVLGEVWPQLDVKVMEFVDSTGYSTHGMQAVGPGGDFKAKLRVKLPYYAAPTRFVGLYVGIVPTEPPGGKG